MGNRNRNRNKKLVGPWRSLHGALWLIGLAVLAWRDWWWPGILVLLALSGIVEALIMQLAPGSYMEEGDGGEASLAPAPLHPVSSPVSPPAKSSAPVVEGHHPELLPSTCPKCGGPIRSQEAKWTGPRSADCPYCGAKLPMEKS